MNEVQTEQFEAQADAGPNKLMTIDPDSFA